MGLFYTGKGDKGYSDLGRNTRNNAENNAELRGRKILVKDSVISEALGGLDELNSLLGLVKHQRISDDFIKLLEETQENLFIVQANVAEALFKEPPTNSEIKNTDIAEIRANTAPSFSIQKVKSLEDIIDKLEREVNPARSFVLPGATPVAGWLDFARSVSRRVERSVVTFSKKYELTPEILAFMNRLSSLLFAMARAEVKRSGWEEKHPSYK